MAWSAAAWWLWSRGEQLPASSTPRLLSLNQAAVADLRAYIVEALDGKGIGGASQWFLLSRPDAEYLADEVIVAVIAAFNTELQLDVYAPRIQDDGPEGGNAGIVRE